MRFDEKFILFENQYRRLGKSELHEMFAERERQISRAQRKDGIANFGQAMYLRKFNADFSVEMNRSV